MIKGTYLKDPSASLPKYKHHSIYGENIPIPIQKRDSSDQLGQIDESAERAQNEFYDSKYRTFLKEKDSDEEESRGEGDIEDGSFIVSKRKIDMPKISEMFFDDEEYPKQDVPSPFNRRELDDSFEAQSPNTPTKKHHILDKQISAIEDWHGPDIRM